MLLRSRPCKRGSCTGPLPSLLFSPRIHNYRNRIPGECPEKSFSYCVNSWRMPSEGPFAAFCAPPRIIEKIHKKRWSVPPLFETVPFRKKDSGLIGYHEVGAIAARLFHPASGGCAAPKPSGAISEVRRPAGGQHPVRARGAAPGGRRTLRYAAPEARSAAAHVRGAR